MYDAAPTFLRFVVMFWFDLSRPCFVRCVFFCFGPGVCSWMQVSCLYTYLNLSVHVIFHLKQSGMCMLMGLGFANHYKPSSKWLQPLIFPSSVLLTRHGSNLPTWYSVLYIFFSSASLKLFQCLDYLETFIGCTCVGSWWDSKIGTW